MGRCAKGLKGNVCMRQTQSSEHWEKCARNLFGICCKIFLLYLSRQLANRHYSFTAVVNGNLCLNPYSCPFYRHIFLFSLNYFSLILKFLVRFIFHFSFILLYFLLSPPFYVSIYLSINLPIYLSIYSPIYLSTNFLASLSLFVFPFFTIHTLNFIASLTLPLFSCIYLYI